MSRSNSTQKQKDRHIREIHKHHHGKIVLENRLADVHDVDPIVRQHIAHLRNDAYPVFSDYRDNRLYGRSL